MSAGNSNGFVRVMRSHDYNQFEVCLPLAERGPDYQTPDELRKVAARLVDKAVRQYEQMKRAEQLADLLRDGRMEVDEREHAEALAAEPDQRTSRQKLVLNRQREKDWIKNHPDGYDYDDDEPDFDDQSPRF